MKASVPFFGVISLRLLCFFMIVGGVLFSLTLTCHAAASVSFDTLHRHHPHHHEHKRKVKRERTAQKLGEDASRVHSVHRPEKVGSSVAKVATVGTAAGAGIAAVREQGLSQPSSADTAGAERPSSESSVLSGDGEALQNGVEGDQANKGSETGLPLPRFASLRADRVYMRRGPGERYPIDWVYHRRGLPMKIEREFGVWRLVEDSEGQKGWVHQVTLRGRRAFVILGDSSAVSLPATQTMPHNREKVQLPAADQADPRIVGYISPGKLPRSLDHDALLMSSTLPDHKVVSVLKPGTVGMIKACLEGSAWCHVTVKGYDGWLERRVLWGLQPGEIIRSD